MMELIDKTEVIALLKSGMLNEDDSLVCDATECNSMLEWAIEEVQKMPPCVYSLVPTEEEEDEAKTEV